ncbi:MAG: phosphonate ABC transporter, permease protein PhnE [Bacillota bacterium]|nr:phosphonate ABC transporter, permease protein PhnE [Bacillota bacterium]
MKERTFWLVVLGALLIWSFLGLSWPGKTLAVGLSMAAKMVEGILHPDWSFAGETLRYLLESLEMAFVGTALSALLAIPFGFWAAAHPIGKAFLAAVRTFPELILAIVFLVGLGPGPFAGVMALAVHSTGMLGKLYGEAVEHVSPGPREALLAVGAPSTSLLWLAVLPQVLPAFLSLAIYRFEINVRAATVLGVVGAGGIGTPLLFSLQAYAWPKVGMMLLAIVVAVFAVDFLSARARQKLV